MNTKQRGAHITDSGRLSRHSFGATADPRPQLGDPSCRPIFLHRSSCERCCARDGRCPAKGRCARGYTLIEMLVYMGVAFLILGLSSAAMYRSMDASAGLRHNANDISSTLSAGERWRDDVRRATGPLGVEKTGEGETVLHIPQQHGEVVYGFSTNVVTRQVAGGGWTPVLEQVKASDFVADQRGKVLAWRWEVELLSYRKAMTRTRPLFTFIAAPINSAK